MITGKDISYNFPEVANPREEMYYTGVVNMFSANFISKPQTFTQQPHTQKIEIY